MGYEKSTVAAYLFLIFLGTWGAHRFYLGRPWTGALYMFTCGLFGLGLLWDLFAIPTYVSTANSYRH
jgi:TM2 domain-containing membrane protein YozV